MSETRILQLNHLAKNALQDWARVPLDIEQVGPGIYNVVLLAQLADALEHAAQESGKDLNEVVVTACRALRKD